MKIFRIFSTIFAICLILTSTSFGRAAFDTESVKEPTTTLSTAEAIAFCNVNHTINKMVLSVNNIGTLGSGWTAGHAGQDCITGDELEDLEYPKGSGVQYLFAASFWIGAIVGRDTLVSSGADGWSSDGNEFNPDISPFGDLIYRSIRRPELVDLYKDAVSEEDYIATYSDTFPYIDQFAWRGLQHRPLNIEVTQRSFAWSYSYAEDFILFDYEIKNIGQTPLEGVYMGFYNDSDVGWEGATDVHTDDICGFRETFTSVYEDACEFLDTVNVAYICDNDGDPVGGAYTEISCPAVTGMRIVRTPGDQLDVSFNWWISNGDVSKDFGPRERSGVGRWDEEFRDFGTGGMGTPEGDRNKYYQLRNQEFDFDQIYTASISAADPVWVQPDQEDAADLADGFDTRYLLSFGPFDIDPGERLPISFAYVCGENFHRDPGNIANLPGDPDAFYANLDFSDMATNSTWASRVYDNPGIDSNGDGDSGAVRICCFDEAETRCDTIWYKGDGVPDFQGASPPPPPTIRLEPTVGSIRVIWNGLRTETTVDVFSRMVDFEGYRVYLGRDNRESSFSMVASYDIEDYNKYVYNPDRLPEAGYELKDVPYSIDSLQALYGADFDPNLYSQLNPYYLPGFDDSMFYFEPQDYNASELGVTTPIRKVYPEQAYPSSLDPTECDPDELTEDGFIKYFEYEMVIDSVLPTVEWWVNVTAFDFGSPESDLEALESSRASGALPIYPLSPYEDVQANNEKVFVYPNPYRVDGGYRADGYEGRQDTDRPDERVRVIHFANLPPKCTIRIYTLDGDMVRELEHDVDPSDPNATHETWNMITRNTQMVVSGIYFWTVEAEDGETQIGKLVIIM